MPRLPVAGLLARGLPQLQNLGFGLLFLWITFVFTVYPVVPGIVLGLGLAMLANQKLPAISIFRTIFASTVATSVAVASMMWLTLLKPTTRLVTRILGPAGPP